MEEKLRVALLIDADNLPIMQVVEALDRLEIISNPIIRKAFGDFTGSAKNWTAEFLLKFGITPIQHFPVSKFKNGADIAMCIAAMDIVHTRSVDAIVLFSSDSDFGPLASRVRETGMEVIGIGDLQTSATFKACFDKFIVVKAPAVVPVKPPVAPKPSISPVMKKAPPAKKAVVNRVVPKSVRSSIIDVMATLAPSGEPILVSKVSNALKERNSTLTPRTYGFASISKLLNSMNEVVLTNGNKSVQLSKVKNT